MVVLVVLCPGAEYLCNLCMFSYFSYIWVTEWPHIGKIAVRLARLAICFLSIST